jgi:hypothetical protein
LTTVDDEENLTETGKPSPNTQTPAPTPTPVAGTDPGSIAKKNLLDRIRATRANAAGVTGKLGGGK